MEQNKNEFSIGERILRLRRHNQLTQKQLAEKLNLSTSTITKYEKGSLEPNIKTLKEIALALNVNVSTLIDDNNFENTLSDLNYFSKFLHGMGFTVFGYENEEYNEIWIVNPNNEIAIVNTNTYKKIQESIEEFTLFKFNQVIESEKKYLGSDIYENIINLDETPITKLKILRSKFNDKYNKENE
ncbi:helix-turn-helix domain-containing protein [Clostridium perfringens]|uniref:helix-turn-helix domain-containing protein n=1 Tax=Clostridium perfringens TaxID=1502 RepID=UPI000D71D3EA|nr:helix-turn-helix transcriptional regulator [Clostridium perfringens]MCX0380705.1 helix-turn-helix domain-containing protein [Clostridium perfringens]MDK0764065.1 helix-turn-helix transcriptional regulator [Clostridium perfringens]MDM0467637.1 helix-turn-helix transcriptional regulator [Clostridium perfringens]PWX52253.1 hypothetical protein CYK61_00680 [Clostridium perfringens]